MFRIFGKITKQNGTVVYEKMGLSRCTDTLNRLFDTKISVNKKEDDLLCANMIVTENNSRFFKNQNKK